MKIVIDIRPLQSGHAKRGIGKYLQNILPTMFQLGRKHTFILYRWKSIPVELDVKKYPNVECRELGGKLLYQIDRVKARLSFGHIKLTTLVEIEGAVFFQPDIFYGLCKKLPTITVIYDIIPLLFKSQYLEKGIRQKSSGGYRCALYTEYINQYADADRLISISESSLHDVIKFVPEVKQVPTTITPLAAQQLPKASNKRAYDYRYLLYVGGNEPRKNVINLVNCFNKIKKQVGTADLKLLLVGFDFVQGQGQNNPLFWHELHESQYLSDIICKGYVHEKELADLYNCAEVFAFPSLYEGFGMPILEAMQSGAPVVAYNNSSIAEITGDAALLASNESEFIDCITRILQDNKLHSQMRKKGYLQSKKFTWLKTAASTLKAIEQTAGN